MFGRGSWQRRAAGGKEADQSGDRCRPRLGLMERGPTCKRHCGYKHVFVE
jgi:hypothetical protein